MLRGGFLYDYSQLCVKGKKISSNHDTSVLIVFIFSHNMALFLLSFFFFFRPFFSAVIVGRQCGHKFEGTYPKRGHTCKIWCHSSLPFCLIFCVLFEKKNHVDGLIFNINIGTHQSFVLKLSEFFQFWQISYSCYQSSQLFSYYIQLRN